MRTFLRSAVPVFALLLGFGGGWMYWGWRWGLAPLEPSPPAADCPALGARPEDLWRSLSERAPGDAARADVRLRRDRDRARLEVVEDLHSDDSVQATARTYWLAWRPSGGWRVTSCSSSVLRCARGPWPAATRCP